MLKLLETKKYFIFIFLFLFCFKYDLRANTNTQEQSNSNYFFLPINDLLSSIDHQKEAENYQQAIKISVTLELSSQNDLTLVQPMIDKIKPVLLDYLKSKTSDILLNEHQILLKIKNDFTNIIDGLVKPIKIKRLFITDIVIQ